VLVATREFRRMAILGVIQAATMLAVTTALWLADALTVAGAVYSFTAGNVVTFIVGIAWLRSAVGRPRLAVEVAREGVSLVGAQLADVGTRRLDQVVALPLLGPVGAGLYSVAAAIGSLSAPIAHAASAAMFRDMAGSESRERDGGSTVIRHGIALGILVTPLLVAATLAGVPLLFGAEFRGAILPAAILVLGTPAAVGAYCATVWMAAQKLGARLTAIQVAILAVMLGGFVLLGWLWSVVGAALAVTVASYVGLLLLVYASSENWRRVLPRGRDFRVAVRIILRGS
jgi:O-antigen/teichoic acid export membrane protein